MEWKAKRFGEQLLLEPLAAPQPSPATHPIAWSPPQAVAEPPSRRRAEGSDIARFGRVLNVTWADTETYQAECLSSRCFLPSDPGAVLYTLQLHVSGFGWCTCSDFMYHSFHAGACKHLYALIEHLKRWQTSHPAYAIPVFDLPTSRNRAVELYHLHSSSIPANLQPRTTMLAAVSAFYDLVDQLDENLLEGDSRELGGSCDGHEASAPGIGEARFDVHDTNKDSLGPASYNEVSSGDNLISSVTDSWMR